MRYRDVAGRLEQLTALRGPIKVLSFDVFDTLIQRRCSRAAVHDRALRELARRLTERGIRSAVSLHDIRHLAVETLCAAAEDEGLDGEFFIGDLYGEILRRCVGDLLPEDERKKLAAELAEFEVECERRACLPIDGMVEQLRRIRSSVGRLVFVSDMYLGAENVQRLLAHCGYGGLFDAGYTSGDTRLYKATGRAFAHVLEAEGVAAAELVHVGDHPVADHEAPRSLGVSTLRVIDPALDRLRLRDALAHPHGPARTVTALQTWTDAVDDPTRSFAFRYGRNMIGPAFASFVHQVRDAAVADDVEVLYFLSRDGFIPQRLYQEAAQSWIGATGGPPARYLVVSRLPMVRAIMVHGLSLKALMSARNQLVPSDRTVSNTLRSLGLDERLIATVCADHLVDPNRTFDDATLQHPKLLSALNDVRLLEEAERVGRDAHALITDYLRQEGLLDHDRVGIVDIGWGGTIQDQLQDLLQHVPHAPALVGYYFGANRSMFERRSPRNRMAPVVSSVLTADGTMRLGNSATFAAVGLIEEAARAPHGTCTGYARRSDATFEGVVPVLKADAERAGELAGEPALMEMQEGIVDFGRHYFDGADFLGVSTEASKALANLALQRFVFHPSPAEIGFWKLVTHTNDIGGLFAIEERLLPPDEPWWRRPAGWRAKTRRSMWTQGAVRYLLGRPGLLIYNPLWTLSYARNVQRDNTIALYGTPVEQPRLKRGALVAPRATGSVGPTPSDLLYEAALARYRELPHDSPVHREPGRMELDAPVVIAGTALTIGAARFSPARYRGGVKIVNDGVSLGAQVRRRLAIWLATPLARAGTSRRSAPRRIQRVARRLLGI